MLPGSMSVRGSLSTMSVEDILGWINRRLLCGTLTVERSPIVRTFVFDAGYVTSASSNEPREELGRMLLDGALVDQVALDEARQVHADTGVSLSRILTMVGKVEEDRLRALLEDRALDGVLDVFTWDDGTFAVERMPRAAEPSDLAIAVQIPECVAEGVQWASRWQEVHKHIPSDDVTLRVVDRDRLVAPADGSSRPEEIAALVQAVERGRSVGQIVAEQRTPRFRSLERLAWLIEEGGLQVSRVRVAPPPPPSPPPSRAEDSAEALVTAAQECTAAGDRAGALDLIRRALALEPQNVAIQKLFRDTERTLFAELSRDLLASFRVPKLLVERDELDQIGLSDTERYLAGRIDGRWDLLSLMRVSPLREVEALIIFKRLADRGIISL